MLNIGKEATPMATALTTRTSFFLLLPAHIKTRCNDANDSFVDFFTARIRRKYTRDAHSLADHSSFG